MADMQYAPMRSRLDQHKDVLFLLYKLQDEDSKEIASDSRHLIATQSQIAMINKLLPKGYKFEVYD